MQALRANNLSGTAAITHGFFGRTGGVSTGVYASLNCGPGSGDARADVIENRKRVAAALGADAKLVTLGQIHSAQVLTVTRPWPIGEKPEDDAKLIPLGDGMATKEPNIALGILAADCAPVLFADGEAGVIGAAHAGWKGALFGVTDATITAMEKLGAARSRIVAAIGPCISQANYEVGSEFRDNFARSDSRNERFFVPSARGGHFRFDLEAYVAHRLAEAGLMDIARLSACTYANEVNYFSFRHATHRNEKDYGRQVSAIMLTK